MIIAQSLESLFKKHKDELTRLYLKDSYKPVTHANLEYFFTDSSDKLLKWYRYPKNMAMPVDRLGMLLKFTQYLAKGLSPEEDESLDQIIEDAIENGLKNPKAKSAAIISTVLTEKKKRRKLCFHTELFYNYLAVQLVREDENPLEYDNEIQMQKVEQLKKEKPDEGMMFFFRQPELEKLKSLLQITQEELEKLLEESKQEIQLLREKVDYLRSLNHISSSGNETGKSGL